MKVLIVEDEKPAQQLLIEGIKSFDSSIEIVGRFGNIKDTTEYLKTHDLPDVIFLDIQLSDGISFEIFKQLEVHCPIIFCTAFDEYLLKSFHYNGIDYLLKPVSQERIHLALSKYSTLQRHFSRDYQQLLSHYSEQKSYKNRILVKKGVDYLSLKIQDIAYFFTEYKVVFAVDFNGQKYIIDKPVAELEELMDKSFYRLNRKFLCNVNAISKFRAIEKGKLKVELQPQPNTEVIVSQEKAASFKAWLNQ